MKKIALFDIDKTIYQGYSYFAFTKYLQERGLLELATYNNVMTIAKEAETGKYTYSETAQKLLITVVADLKGRQVSDLEAAAHDFFLQHKNNFYQYFTSLVEKISSTYDCYVISANAQFVSGAVKQLFNLQGSVSSVFEVKEGKFTGIIEQSLALGKSLVKDLIDKYGKAGSIAVGDSINDKGMLELVENAFCINASEDLVALATERQWHVVDDQHIEQELLKITTAR